ncbi:hypothetical protein [Mycobacteroides abscessus]|uniref:hypothetical protein n=1 Tax=Mycobacteroides abscessus TaxID=36809 RepID=UPI0009C9420A|nr:hypothetical protein [Mycobacteroides abscessus]SLH41598.1 Uncharacterised protein [Mycobacteroides abscessus subsp. massiliense]
MKIRTMLLAGLTVVAGVMAALVTQSGQDDGAQRSAHECSPFSITALTIVPGRAQIAEPEQSVDDSWIQHRTVNTLQIRLPDGLNMKQVRLADGTTLHLDTTCEH